MKSAHSHSLLLVFAIIVTLVVGAVYGYMSRAVGVSVAKSSAARSAVLAAQTNSNRDQAFMRQFQLTAQDWARLPEFFVPSDDILTFIEAVEAFGSVTGATTTLSSIEADNLDNAATGTLGSIRLHVDVEGTWSAGMRTLKLAEAMPYKVTFNNIRLDFTPGTPDGNTRRNWRTSFDMRASMIARHSAVPTAVPKATSP